MYRIGARKLKKSKKRAATALRYVMTGHDIVVTRHGEAVAVLTALTGDDMEDWLLDHNPGLRGELDEAWEKYVSGEEPGIPAAEVFQRLGLAPLGDPEGQSGHDGATSAG